MSSLVNLARFLRTFSYRTHPVAASVTNLVNHIILSVFYIFVFFSKKEYALLIQFADFLLFQQFFIFLYW